MSAYFNWIHLLALRAEPPFPGRPGSPTPRSALPRAGPGGHDAVHAVQLSALETAGAGNGGREGKKPKLGVALRGGQKAFFFFCSDLSLSLSKKNIVLGMKHRSGGH